MVYAVILNTAWQLIALIYKIQLKTQRFYLHHINFNNLVVYSTYNNQKANTFFYKQINLFTS